MQKSFVVAVALMGFASSAHASVITLGVAQDSSSERLSFIQAIQQARSIPTAHDTIVVQGESLNLETSLSTLFGFQNSVSGASLPAAPRVAGGNGDVYMMWGDLGDAWTEQEYDKFYSISKFLVRNGFRNLINATAFEADVREAVANPKTAVIMWSSHGSTDGKIYATDDVALPQDTFSLNVSSAFKQIVLSNCYGEATVQYYPFPAQVATHHWTGPTTTDEFFTYLTTTWSADLQKDLGVTIQ